MKPEPPKPIESPEPQQGLLRAQRDQRIYTCDRCGARMVERQCKIVCHNCGNRFDCSDLNIHFD